MLISLPTVLILCFHHRVHFAGCNLVLPGFFQDCWHNFDSIPPVVIWRWTRCLFLWATL